MRKTLVLAGVFALLSGALPAQAAAEIQAVTANVTHDPGNGTFSLTVQREGRTVVSPSPVGIRTAAADLTSGLREVSRSTRTVSENYRMTTGKRLDRTVRHTETRISIAGAGNARFDLVVRVADDGVAYRYELPEATDVLSEASAFSIPANANAWLMPYNPQHENRRFRTTAGGASAGEYGNPSLFEVGQDFVLLTESNVDGRYAGSSLRHTGGGVYQVQLKDQRVAGARIGPWRTVIVGDLATVTESTLVDDLAEPSRIADTSWIRPGKVAWSWLSEHSSPSDFERQKVYVDFAARNGWPYVLVDEGWSDKWVPELTRYARAKGVDILLWFHWNRLDTAAEREATLPLLQRWGVKGVKVDFMESDSQVRYQFYDAILADTAQRKLMINFHGSTIPHGLARTWPHLLTMEAVHGAEQLPLPDGNPIQPFTRNVVGSMDFTPVSLEVGPKVTSIGHEIALPVVFESGWTHFADKPEAYDRYPEALRFLDQVPTVWQQTELVNGYPGETAVFARRNGERWFVGGIAVGGARTMTAPLNFLGPGPWLVETIRDNGRSDVTRTSSRMSASDTLSVQVPANGGFAAVICPATEGRTTCYNSIPQVPATSLTITPTNSVTAKPGSTFEVTGSFTVNSIRPVMDVVLKPTAPEGWTVAGNPVTTRLLRQGEVLSGKWTVQVPVTARSGGFEVPIAAEYRVPDFPQVHVAKAVRGLVPLTGQAYVSDLPFDSATNGWGPVERDMSNGESGGGDGRPMSIAGTTYTKGIGVHAESEVVISLGGTCRAFTAKVGMDDETTSPGSSVFQVVGDGRVLQQSGVLRTGDAPLAFNVDITGVQVLSLKVTDGGDGKNFDHANWAEAHIACNA
ncbi:glycoside hydrolase family 97 catalytic domain-containing protein [Kibdelosporangium aridum]|uniref:NPCBM-associated, NEW3 domain of alpha-galactosidase n=1 Tax=Kibdelosporangium aridum TaxID=2030 RepID=A0A1W2EB71_KIBAR|nr:glycoside hydrolase family 97 catalytic domain-containing protein [Kibdelosporangium aridum]SMD06586.1 NPCBM-associated, NEW3 domain of alpha-galactosidase [Kibdelosporangium aridum]